MFVKQSVLKSLSPSCNYPHYSRLLHLRPLPLSSSPADEDQEDDEDSFEQQPDGQEDHSSSSAGEEDTFLPTSRHRSTTKQRKPSRNGRSSHHRKKHHKSEASDDQTESPRRPLASSVHQNRQLQRLNNHPNMAPRSKTRGSKRAAQEVAEQEDDTTKENEALKLQLHRLTKRMKAERTGKKKKAKSGTESAMEREVRKKTKQGLWKVCKFIKSEAKLGKATKFVMEKMTLVEMEGLTGTALIDAQEIWKAEYKPEVRKSLNKQRNYAQQELRELMEEEVFPKNKEAEFPTDNEILELCMRDKLDDKTDEAERKRYQVLFDNYWNVLIPKVAGHYAWGPTKRHHGLLSEMKQDDTDPEAMPCVSASDEAFLVILWLNCYPKWKFREECKRQTPQVDVAEDDPQMQTLYTDAKGGQMKFGGWSSEGVKKYEEVLEMIQKNRTDQQVYIKQVEELALSRIRKQEKVDEKEAARKTKKKAAKKKDEPDEEETDDENDYSNW